VIELGPSEVFYFGAVRLPYGAIGVGVCVVAAIYYLVEIFREFFQRSGGNRVEPASARIAVGWGTPRVELPVTFGLIPKPARFLKFRKHAAPKFKI